MSKVTLTNITSGNATVDDLNDNFSAITTAIENTLSRDGTTPNQMEADLDMNGFAILNALATGSTDVNWTYIGDWATATDYVRNNIVYVTIATDATYGGASYVCRTSHTSGTFSTDYLAGKWGLLAARGTAGAGSGNVNGPGSSVVGNVVLWNNTSGTLVSDSGVVLGTAAPLDHGTSNGNLVRLDATGLPAVDGSQLTGLTAAQGICPTGMVVPYAGTSPPTGWLLCDGSAVSRTTYATLYTLLGDSWGAGDAATTFNLPDLRGRVVVCLDNLGGSSANRVTATAADSLGSSSAGGSENVTLTSSQMPAHTHTTTIVYSDQSGGANYQPVHGGGSGNALNTRTYNHTSDSQGSSSSHTNMQPWMTMAYIIKY